MTDNIPQSQWSTELEVRLTYLKDHFANDTDMTPEEYEEYMKLMEVKSGQAKPRS